MMNQNLSNLTEHPQNASASSDSFQKPKTSKLLSQKKDEYLEASRSQKIKVYLQNKRLSALSNQDKLEEGLSLQESIAENEERANTLTVEQLNELVASLDSANLYKQYFAVTSIRKLLSTNSPRIQLFIDAGVIPRLIEFIGREDQHQLQAETAWALSNLSSGTTEQTQKIVENGAIPALIKLLRSPHHDVRLEALWPLGNFAGDSASFRDMVLQGEAIAPLVEILEKAISEGDKHMIRDSNWVLANLCGTKPVPPFEEIKEVLSAFAKVVMSQEDPEILLNAISCVSSFSDGNTERIQHVLDSGVLPSILKHMDNPHLPLVLGCLMAIRDICKRSGEQVDTPGVMEKLFSALQSKHKVVRKEAISVIANITTGTPDHIEYIVGNIEYLDQLMSNGLNDIVEVRKEIGRIFLNALENANEEQLRILFEKKIMGLFGKMIEEDGDVRIQEIGLKGILKIVNLRGWGILKGLEENKICEKIEKLQYHCNGQIYELVMKILDCSHNDEN